MSGVELARGGVRDQPWGLTLGAIAQRSTTGEMTIVDGATRVVLVFDDGFLVGGSSTRQAPTLLERAARTFDLPNATWVLDDRPTVLRREPAIDLRAVIFTGARRYLDDERLLRELRQLGTRYSLGPGALAELPRYGGDAPVAIADALREGASLPELEAAHGGVDRRELQAFVYALVSCGTVRGMLPARAPTPPPDPRTITPNRTVTPNRTITPNRATPVPVESRTTSPTNDSGRLLARIPTVNIARQPTPPGSRAITPPGTRTTTTRDPLPAPPRTSTTLDPVPPRTSTTKDAIPPMVTDEDVPVVRTTTTRDPVREIVRQPATRDDEVDLSRTATRRDPEPQPLPPPPRVARTQSPRDEDTGQIRKATPARGTSFSTPSHGVKIIAPDDEAKYRAGQAADRARRLIEAHEYVQASNEALAATRLVPDSFDYQALHAWATFLGAKDKTAAAEATRKLFEKATHRAAQPNDVRMMLGKLERIVGREREALRHFKAVIERDPTHAEAATLIREIETQLEAFARR